jgi:hypothetical protein
MFGWRFTHRIRRRSKASHSSGLFGIQALQVIVTACNEGKEFVFGHHLSSRLQ